MRTQTTSSSTHSRPTPAIALALVLLLALGAGGALVVQTIRMVPGAAVPGSYVSEAKKARNTAPTGALSRPLFSGPGWGTMTLPQKLALYPLAERWDYMTEGQKRRWLALAETFGDMPEAEQKRLHDRMTTWAELTAQQRSQARLNFATARALSPPDIQSQWEAYQALSDEQKRRLAAGAPKPRGAATALKPVPSKRLVHVPTPSFAQSQSPNPPKIVLPSTTAVRAPPPPVFVELPPAPPPLPAPAPTEPPPVKEPDAQTSSPSDPLPELYIN